MLAPGSGAAPVVLIIPGSGPTDRDGNSPWGVKAASYRLLAEALAEKGLAAKLIAGFEGPVLIVQGGRDLQIKVADAERLRAAELVVLAKVNHVLKEVETDDVRANAAAYADPSLPIAPGLVDAVAAFVTRKGAR
jgi:pimeloyl-ACP methyl ester carboxylesterase